MYLADSSLNIFMGCLSSRANNSPPGKKSVIKQTCVGVWEDRGTSVYLIVFGELLIVNYKRKIEKKNRKGYQFSKLASRWVLEHKINTPTMF